MTKTNNYSSQLERNIATFNEQLPELLKNNEEKYAVGSEGDDFNCFDNYVDALQHGYDSYGVNKEFLVREVLKSQRIHTITRLL